MDGDGVVGRLKSPLSLLGELKNGGACLCGEVTEIRGGPAGTRYPLIRHKEGDRSKQSGTRAFSGMMDEENREVGRLEGTYGLEELRIDSDNRKIFKVGLEGEPGPQKYLEKLDNNMSELARPQ